MSQDSRYLILGGSSFVGRHLFRRLGDELFLATYAHHRVEYASHFNAVTMKLADVIKDPAAFRFGIILFGDTNPDTCIADIKKSQQLNVEKTIEVIEQLVKWGIKPIFTSTEFVFDGSKGNYLETDPPNPILVYGEQKVTIEKYIQSHCDNYIIMRLAKVYGITPGDGTLFTNWMKMIEAGETIRCATDQIFSPVYVEDVVNSIIHLAQGDFNGLYHVAGNQAYSRIELLEKLLSQINKRMPVNVPVIRCSIHDFDLPEKRPLNVSLNPQELIKIDFQFGDIEQHIEQTIDNFWRHNDAIHNSVKRP